MLENLKERVWKANLDLVEHGLVVLTWGNVSAKDPETGLIVIKPSGIDYEKMGKDDMVVVDANGKVVEGRWKPSSDTLTHVELYRHHPEIGGIVHTHSTFATAFAQAEKPIKPYGTTHADTFYGSVPLTRKLTPLEVAGEYEKNTGSVINETFRDQDILSIPACLVKNHGPFTWGKSCESAVQTAVILEEVAKMAYLTETLNPQSIQIDSYLLDKHYFRKHGKKAYYGQEEQ